MKRSLRPLGLFGGIILAMGACTKGYFDFDKFEGGAYQPTFAVPLAEANITVDQVLNRWDSDIEKIYSSEHSNPDSVFSLNLIYEDSLDPVLDNVFAVGGQSVMQTFSLPTESVLLRIFGNFDDGYFRLNKPEIEFTIDNQSNVPFTLTFRDGDNGDFYTAKIDDDNTPIASTVRYLELLDNDWPIPASGMYSQTLKNSNTIYVADPSDSALTSIIEPTPKKMFYGIDITPTAAVTTNGGSVYVHSRLTLPLQGWGKINFKDTLTMQAFDDTAYVDNLGYMELRMIVENGLPLDATIKATVYDSTASGLVPLLDLRLMDEDDNLKTTNMVIPGATAGSASQDYRPQATVTELTDIVISSFENASYTDASGAVVTNANMNEVEALIEGEKIVITAVATTTGESNQETVRMYSDYTMNIKLGVKVNANMDINEVTP